MVSSLCTWCTHLAPVILPSATLLLTSWCTIEGCLWVFAVINCMAVIVLMWRPLQIPNTSAFCLQISPDSALAIAEQSLSLGTNLGPKPGSPGWREDCPGHAEVMMDRPAWTPDSGPASQWAKSLLSLGFHVWKGLCMIPGTQQWWTLTVVSGQPVIWSFSQQLPRPGKPWRSSRTCRPW